MAKKNSAESIYKQMQKMNNETQIKLQQLTTQANKQTLDFNKQEAATARAWQQQMSETSHQMEVADLKKAGLNPVLSANSGGAQSYSTSSASAQAESGANAMANLQGSYISSYAGLKGTELSAAAQKQAAATAAAATRAAAAEAAAATRYAASLGYAQNKERIEFEKWKVQNEPSGNIFKILDRDLNLGGKGNNSLLKNFFKSAIQPTNKKITDYSQLSRSYKALLDRNLNKLHIPQTNRNRNIFLSASQGNKKSISSLNTLYKVYSQKRNQKTQDNSLLARYSSARSQSNKKPNFIQKIFSPY